VSLGPKAHRLLEVDPQTRTAVCVICGPTRVRPKKTRKGTYRLRCVNALRKWRKNSDYTYRQRKRDRCERCGFIPEHPSQLDVNHRNGNHHDNSPENLETLCANCHRLVTALAGHSARGGTANASNVKLKIIPNELLVEKQRLAEESLLDAYLSRCA